MSTSTPTTTTTVTQRDIAALKDHPANYNYFAPTSDAELDELTADIRRRGLQQPIQILPDGTIIAGHRRVEAFRRLGRKKIPAIVRDDLGDADDARVREELIQDNVMRRQLDDISLARCYRELKFLAEEQGVDEEGDLRDILAERLNLGRSGRTLDRLLRLLDLPGEIQDMITNGQLTKSQGGDILKLDADVQEKVCAALLEGDAPRDVLREFAVPSSTGRVSPVRQAENFLRMFQRDIAPFAGEVERLDGVRVGSDTLEVIEDAAAFFHDWLERMRSTWNE